MNKDITTQVDFDNPDDELLPLTKCVCGQKFESWEFTISIYDKNPTTCPSCKRGLFFRQAIRVYEVLPNPRRRLAGALDPCLAKWSEQ